MNMARLELAHGAAICTDPENDLPLGLDPTVTDGDPAGAAPARALGRDRAAAWRFDRPEPEGDWQWPVAVADADIEDDFGDFCGRRVA
ncbi:MAG TPA: hypothetical protein VE011_05190 [Candidatus Dormibacteraeota bacterium]|nr:hypothetical protein [Candidatus Dormibacteraeota bacterium]